LGSDGVAACSRRLEATTHSVNRIAMQVGFGSATAFRGHFKQIVGTSPQAFRHAFQGS
jgi:transcriptional regulator GlxA family with amidase domain